MTHDDTFSHPISPGVDADGSITYAIGAVEPTRAHAVSSARTISLDGTWDFRFHPSPPLDEGVPAFATQGAQAQGPWRAIDVPGHWCLAPDAPSRPAYTNVTFPFPIDPPYVPDDNPTGDYCRVIDLSDLPAGGRVLLRFLGVESHARVWIDGTEVGSFLGSRLTHDLDITDAVASRSRHLLAVRVHQFSAGSYLEDQDQWWLPGIFRSVLVVHKPTGGIADLTVDTDFDPQTRTGYAHVKALCSPGVTVDFTSTLPVQNHTVVANEHGVAEATWSLAEAQPWSPARPRCFEVSASTDTETLTVTSGFTRIAIVDGQLQANGRRLVIRGMNRHEITAEGGRVFDRERARADLLLMKRHNVNAIRTAHYTPHPELLDLCDELGLWVMVECDIETHGFEAVDWRGNPASEPIWRAAILDRVNRMLARDRNHPCVFSWSLGNESWTGPHLAAAARLIRDIDPMRPVHYEGDYEADYQDFHSRMYPTLEEIDAFFAESGPLAVESHPCSRLTPDQRAHARSRPYIMIEYLHAMGTGPGECERTWRPVREHPTHAGGFVWEWRDHALKLPDGHLGYGGDYGEDIHDGNFVCDGMVDASSRPSAGLAAWANTVAPVWASLEDGRIVVRNDDDIDGYDVEVRLLTWSSGTRTHQVSLAPGATLPLDVTPPRDLRAIAVCERWEGPDADETAVTDLTDPEAPLGGIGTVRQGWRLVSVRPCTTTHPADLPGDCADSATDLPFVAGLPAAWTPRVLTWRAPTDNDSGHGHLDYWGADPHTTTGAGLGRRGPSSADRWYAAGLHLARTTTRSLSEESWRARTASPLGTWSLETTMACTRVSPASWRLSIAAEPTGEWPLIIPRIGYSWRLPADLSDIAWLGWGPTISYSDMREGTWPGLFAGQPEAMWEHSLHPQESSSRVGVASLAFTCDDQRWRVDFSEGVSVSLCPYTPRELTDAAHSWQLPSSDAWWLTVDGIHHGLGSRSCGPDVRPRSQAHPTSTRFNVTITALSRI